MSQRRPFMAAEHRHAGRFDRGAMRPGDRGVSSFAAAPRPPGRRGSAALTAKRCA